MNEPTMTPGRLAKAVELAQLIVDEGGVWQETHMDGGRLRTMKSDQVVDAEDVELLAYALAAFAEGEEERERAIREMVEEDEQTK